MRHDKTQTRERTCAACHLPLTKANALGDRVVCGFCFTEKALTGGTWEGVGKDVRYAKERGWIGVLSIPSACEVCDSELGLEPVSEFGEARWLCKECRAF